jgi:chromosome segregation ATPase
MPDVLTRLILEAQGYPDAEKQIKSLRKTQDQLSKEMIEAAKIYGKNSKEFEDLLTIYKAAVNAEKTLRDEVNKTNDTLGDRRKVLAANDQFDRTSRGVSLAGDVESNLRTVGGAAGAFGATGIERGISQVAEVPALIEALPRLKDAFVGLPAVVDTAAQALGAGGIAFTAFAAVAIAVVSSILEQQGKAAAALGTYIDEYEAFNRAVLEGSQTTEQTIKELEQLNRLREFETQNVKDIQQRLDGEFVGLDPLERAAKELDPTVKELRSQLDEATKAEQSNKDAIQLREDALKDNTLAANDAAQAERELAQERIGEAALQGDLAELSARAANQSREQIDAQIQELEYRRLNLEAQLAYLEAQGRHYRCHP